MSHDWVLWVLVTASALHVVDRHLGGGSRLAGAGLHARLPALCLINAVFFHLLPSFRAGRPNPGVFTATLRYVPIAIWAYFAASGDGVLDPGTFVLSLALGALAMASTIGMLILGGRLGYADVDPASLDAANPSTSSAPR